MRTVGTSSLRDAMQVALSFGTLRSRGR